MKWTLAGYIAGIGAILAFLKAATRKDEEYEDGIPWHDPEWWALHTEAELDLMKLWGTSVHIEDKHCWVRCIVHNPSEGIHRDYPVYWRGDLGILERICEHGVGHPDPDQFYWLSINGQMGRAIHGCDGCCGEWRQKIRGIE